jgi:hypothetical protein
MIRKGKVLWGIVAMIGTDYKFAPGGNTMKFFITSSFVLITCLIFGQTKVIFNLKDECRDSLINIEWKVIESGNEITRDTNSKYFILDFKKEYFVYATYFRGDNMKLLNFSFKITEKDSMVKLVELPKLSNFFTGNSLNYDERYFICEQICDGYCVDYYDNGNKRVEGYFVKGLPKKKLVYYNPDGTKEYIEKYSKKGTLIKTIKSR